MERRASSPVRAAVLTGVDACRSINSIHFRSHLLNPLPEAAFARFPHHKNDYLLHLGTTIDRKISGKSLFGAGIQFTE
jgi:hypothetical protein